MNHIVNRQARGGGNSSCRWEGILIVADQGTTPSISYGARALQPGGCSRESPLCCRQSSLRRFFDSFRRSGSSLGYDGIDMTYPAGP